MSDAFRASAVAACQVLVSFAKLRRSVGAIVPVEGEILARLFTSGFSGGGGVLGEPALKGEPQADEHKDGQKCLRDRHQTLLLRDSSASLDQVRRSQQHYATQGQK